MSYYENRIKELEHRIEQMARANRLKAIPVEAQLIDRIAELNKELARLRASSFVTAVPVEHYERVVKAGDELERVLISRSGSYEAGNASHEWQSAKNYKPSV